MKIMCGTSNKKDKHVALSGLEITFYALTQDYVLLRPELIHYGASPLSFRYKFLNILKRINIIS